MTSILVQSALDANLAALSRVNSDVVALLEQAAPALDVSFVQTPQGIPAGLLDGRQMCSKHRPRDEAQRLVESIDLVEHAVVVVMGFGMGYHVQELAERIGKAGAIIVYEPDISVMRAVLEQVDHSQWIEKSNIIWCVNANDRGTLAGKLKGSESILAQGVKFLDHPVSRDRLGSRSGEFARMLSEFMDSTRTVLLTNLMRAADTARNLLLNIDHYVAGDGIAELKDVATDIPAVVVSAGPSLRRNMHLLQQPGIRDRVVIIAVQTVLKPLLEAGIKPHFVTALDYHEISRRFYEGLTERDVEGVTLVAEPKVHPAVLDIFPGTIRCCGASFLDDLLGDAQREMGSLPPGTTVAHLCMYLARHLGCNPIAMIGQDLGFTDGLYYGPGTAIDDVWSPELNSFNTIEMMQWQRIARHRSHLHKTVDAQGRPMYSDAQMMAYLQQFERDFSAYRAKGVRVIDATEGGVAKQHVEVMPLKQVLEEFAHREHALEACCREARGADADHVKAVCRRLAERRREIATLRELSRRTYRLIEKMIEDQNDQSKMSRHFAKLKKFQQRVAEHHEAFKILEYVNQLGSFNRRKADRKLHMQLELTELQRQRLELERDRENIAWIKDTADELIDQLTRAEQLLGDEQSEPQQRTSATSGSEQDDANVPQDSAASPPSGCRVAAFVPVDPARSSLGIARSLADHVHGKTILQATLERLSDSQTLERIVLIVPEGFDVQTLFDRKRLRLPVDVEQCSGDSPYGERHRAIAVARLFSETSWRGGIGGMSIYDELLCPSIMHEIMQRRGLNAALVVGPDWPLVDVTSSDGCDAVVRRYWTQPEKHRLVITQSPPGLCGCVVSAALMGEIAAGDQEQGRSVGTTLGAAMVYQPKSPSGDIIGTAANVQIDHRRRNALIRATCDLPRWRDAVSTCESNDETVEPRMVVPPHVVLELCVERTSSGLFREHLQHAGSGEPQRQPMPLAVAQRVLEQIGATGEAVLTLGGIGDPLLHPQYEAIIAMAKDAGVRAVHVRTELLVNRDMIDRLVGSGVDVVSIDLHADSAATYQTMMGADRFDEVMANVQYLLQRRGAAPNALALPWVVPRLQRCAATYMDVERFYDRWLQTVGAAVIEGVPGDAALNDGLEQAVTPQKVVQRELQRRMLIQSDGTVPVCELDHAGVHNAGSVTVHSLAELWSELRTLREHAEPQPRTCFP